MDVAYAVVTILLARIVLKEVLSALQWLGIVLIFGRVAAIGGLG